MPKMIYLGILFVLTLLVVAFAGMIREKQDRSVKAYLHFLLQSLLPL